MEQPLQIRPLKPQDVTNALVRTISDLLAQLSEQPPRMSRKTLLEIVGQRHTRLYTAYLDGKLVGMLTATIHRLPTRRSMVIEDVVVDMKVRGHGVGRRLMEAAIVWAKRRDVDTIHLTSHPRRVAANKMYRSLGFEQRETNVYVYDVGG